MLVFFIGCHGSMVSAQSNGITVLSDLAYGEAADQLMDVYLPADEAEGAPVLFMVHGGAWRIGDKASRSVVKHKVAHWVGRGFVLVSVNYRMLPDAQPLEQAEDVTQALIFAQENAAQWGGSPNRFVLMGHSAGAHLVSLVSARQDSAVRAWLGTVALDSAAYDVEAIMRAESPQRLYREAFGPDPDSWRDASPLHVLASRLPPFLAVCSATRKDNPCAQAHAFLDKAKGYGTPTQLLALDLSHRKINTELGSDACYTLEVDRFIGQLDPRIQSMLAGHYTAREQRRIQRRCPPA